MGAKSQQAAISSDYLHFSLHCDAEEGEGEVDETGREEGKKGKVRMGEGAKWDKKGVRKGGGKRERERR